MRNTDVLIVGAGPAGLAAAIAMRQRGMRVTIADIARPPIDKACGEGLMPPGVEALRRLGVMVGPEHAFPFNGISFIEDDLLAEGSFSGAFGLGIRRTTLHNLLAARASEMGAEARWGAAVARLSTEAAWVGGERTIFRWLIGADGYNSRIREFARLRPRYSRRRIGFRRHYRTRPWSDRVEVHWSERCQAYVTPLGADEVGIAMVGEEPAPRLDDLPRIFPALWERLKDARPSSPARGSVSASMSLRAVVRGNVALAGDASGSVDAITGDGLSLAFEQAHALADALELDELARYRTSHRRIARLPRLMSRVLLLLARHGGLRRRVFAAFAAEPPVFSRFLSAHAGIITPLSLGAGTIAGLGWRMLYPGAITSRSATFSYDAEKNDNIVNIVGMCASRAVGDGLAGTLVTADGPAATESGPNPD
jgi:flavin-dependent dehydrogenase